MGKTSIIVSKIISVLLHPLLMPSYITLVIFNTNTYLSYLPFEVKKMVYILIFLCTFLIPISMIPFFINLKLISGVTLKSHRERTIPLFISALAYFFAYYLLSRLPLSTIDFITAMVMASMLLIIVCLAISLKWKISAHLIGMGGLMASLFFYAVNYYANYTNLLIIASLLTGVAGYARLKLQAHSPFQIYAGFLLGFSGMLSVLYFGV